MHIYTCIWISFAMCPRNVEPPTKRVLEYFFCVFECAPCFHCFIQSIYSFVHVYVCIYVYIYTSNRQNYCNTNLVLLRLDLAEGCAKPSLPMGDDPRPIPMFYMSRLKVWESRILTTNRGLHTLICEWHENKQVFSSAFIYINIYI
jgi:hypothetical protein